MDGESGDQRQKDTWKTCKHCLLEKKSWLVRVLEHNRRVRRENGVPSARLINLPINRSFKLGSKGVLVDQRSKKL